MSQNNVPIAIIVAQSDNRVIGVKNELPWHLPEDLKFFKQITLGRPIVMGRKTYESIGRPLPGRTNIVVTRQQDWSVEGVVVASSLTQAIELAAEELPEEVMIIGGAQIYAEALDLVDRIYLTQVHVVLEGDAHFPQFDEDQWSRKVLREVKAEDALPSYSFLTFDRL